MTYSITDVAREAQVAPSTVSLVLNGKRNVSAQTRSHVKAVIRRMRYKPRKARRTPRIAVVYTQNMIVNGVLAEYCRRWIEGVRMSLSTSRSHVSIFAGLSHVDQDLVFTQSLDHHEWDGVIMMGAYPKHGYLERVVASGVPMVAFARSPEHAEFSAVSVNHRAIGSQASAAFHEHGHRKVALLLGSKETYPGRMLYSGFMEANQAHGVELVFDLTTTQSDMSADQVDEALDQVLASGATAIFGGDPIAQKLGNALEKRGITPGRDISILGIDDMGLHTRGGRRITSMGYDKQIMGQIAGQMILHLLQMGDHISHQFTVVQPFLVKGDTLGRVISQ